MSGAVELHREVLEFARSGQDAEVVDAASRYLERFAESEDAEIRSLTAGVVVTLLPSKVRLAPTEALVMCDAVFARYADADVFEGPAVAAAALRVKIMLLKQAGEADNARAVVTQLESSYAGLDDSRDLIQPAGQLIATAKRLLRDERSVPAIVLLRAVTQRRDIAEDQDARQILALAQLWVVIGLTWDIDPGPLLAESEKLDVMGDDALVAIDRLLRELNGQQPSRRAMVLLIGLKIDSLAAQGHDDQAREVRQGFIDAFDGKWQDIPAVAQLVERFKVDLAAM